MLFSFVQFELAHGIGPPPGRYVLGPSPAANAAGEGPPSAAGTSRAAAVEPATIPGQGGPPPSGFLTGVSRPVASADLIVLTQTGARAAPPGRLTRRRSRVQDGADPAPAEVPILRASFVRASTPFPDRTAADRHLDACRDAEPAREREVEEALRALNEMIRAHRAAAPDPYAVEITREHARVVRIGYGGGDEVACGGWLRAISLSPGAGPRMSREERARPGEELAAALSGRAPLLEGEDLLVGAALHLDQDRWRAGARAAAASVPLAIAELRAQGDEASEQAAQALEQALPGLEAAAARALSGELSESDRAALRDACRAAGTALGRWRLGRAREGQQEPEASRTGA